MTGHQLVIDLQDWTLQLAKTYQNPEEKRNCDLMGDKVVGLCAASSPRERDSDVVELARILKSKLENPDKKRVKHQTKSH